MEKETHVVKDSTQKNLALDPDKQKEFKKNNKKIKAKVVFVNFELFMVENRVYFPYKL